MADETDDEELDQEMQQILEKEAQEKAAKKPEPEPVNEAPKSQVPEPKEEPRAGETQPPVKPDDDPIEWARSKGLDTPEAIARSFQNLEKEFHKRNQNGHPGYQDLGNPRPEPPIPPQWTPQPQYQPYPMPNQDVAKNIARRYQMDPEDVERLLPMIVDTATAITARERLALERQLAEIRQQGSQTGEMFQLMQDPDFANPIVVKEMHSIFESQPELFRQPGAKTKVFNMALGNIARKQIQQTREKMPPVTAGGSAGRSAPIPSPMKHFESLSDDEKMKYLIKTGKDVPLI